MNSLDPTAGIPGDSLQDYHSLNATLNINDLSDYLTMVERFLNCDYWQAREGAIDALKALRAMINGNVEYADIKRRSYLRIAAAARITADETLPKPILTTKKDTTL